MALLTPYNLPLLVLAYLLGSIPFGLLLAKLFGGSDLRKSGSGTSGAHPDPAARRRKGRASSLARRTPLRTKRNSDHARRSGRVARPLLSGVAEIQRRQRSGHRARRLPD